MLTTIPARDILSIVDSIHRNPHSILGMHEVEITMKGKKKRLQTVRAWLPDTRSAFVVDSDDPEAKWPMEQVHEAGLYEAIIWERSKPFHYKLEVEGLYGHQWTSEDPYENWVEEVTEFDRHLLNTATHYHLYEKLGAHVMERNGVRGTHFAVWAPEAARVSVIGNFNNWDGRRDVMEYLDESGLWSLFKPGVLEGETYKFEIKTKDGRLLEKADPYAFYAEQRPKTASIVYTLPDFQWSDQSWMRKRSKKDSLNQAVSIYEVQLASWMRVPEEDNRFLTYRELADHLVDYVKELGFTHIQLMPVAEYPFDGSWGYQVTGYFAPTSRFGTPEDLQFFIDTCHSHDIGVLLDWVPAHFPKDAHGLAEFDGTCLYEHMDPRQGEHPEWGTKVFNYGRNQVKNFLISNALYWLDKFHFDGLRVDAVASMLYLDYSRKHGEWIPNEYGGRENLEAVEFLKHMNSVVYNYFPGVMMIAEESTAWPNVSRPTYLGGLGFGYKWNMGWMHDVLSYMRNDPIHRRYRHGQLTFSFAYAWSENYILPLSHDEVVHGKGSLINKMPGDRWQKFANLRLLYTYMWCHPGKQMLFMGQEFAQFAEWSEERSLDWHLLEDDDHRGVQDLIRDLNKLYKREAALWDDDFTPAGFAAINFEDSDNSVLSFLRKTKDNTRQLIVIGNFTPIPRENYTIGVPEPGRYREVFNSDSRDYGGGGIRNKPVRTREQDAFGFPFSLTLSLPPLAAVVLRREKSRRP